jgi:mannose-6-phosphate isomerase-like protein (cupin superfamily)
MTLGVTDIGPGQPNPFHPHRHAQSEIYYVLSGEGVVSIAGIEHPLRTGTSVFIPGNEWHGTRTRPNACDQERLQDQCGYVLEGSS